MPGFAHLLSRAKDLTTESAGAATHRVLLVLLCLAVFVPPLFRGFIDSDETRYAEIIREMVESGDWTVPHFNYVPFILKPPLAYWAGACCVKVFGFHPWVLRLVPLLAAILGVLATYELGAAATSRRTGLIAGAILATSAMYVILADSLVLDMLFSALLFGAWWTFWRYYEAGGQRRLWIILFWLFTALACFTKGPLGGAFVVVVIAVFLLLRRDWPFALKLRPLMGLAILAAVNLPWIILIYRHDPRLVSFLYLRVNLSGIYGAILQRAKPPYFYFWALPLGFIPWSLVAVAAVVLTMTEIAEKGRRTTAAGLLWVVGIFIGGFVLLSLSAAKMETYCLPIYPAAAILTARYLERSAGGRKWERLLVPAQCVAATVVMLYLVLAPPRLRFEPTLRNPVVLTLAILILLAWAGLVLASMASLRGKFRGAMLTMGVTAAIVFPIGLMQIPRLATWRTAQVLCETFKQELTKADVVVLTDPNDYSVPLYLGRRVAVVGRAGEFGVGLWVENHPPDQPIPVAPFRLRSEQVLSPYVLDLDDVLRLWSSQQTVYLFATRDFLERFQQLFPNPWFLGSNGRLILLTNTPSAPARQAGAYPPALDAPSTTPSTSRNRPPSRPQTKSTPP